MIKRLKGSSRSLRLFRKKEKDRKSCSIDYHLITASMMQTLADIQIIEVHSRTMCTKLLYLVKFCLIICKTSSKEWSIYKISRSKNQRRLSSKASKSRNTFTRRLGHLRHQHFLSQRRSFMIWSKIWARWIQDNLKPWKTTLNMCVDVILSKEKEIWQ